MNSKFFNAVSKIRYLALLMFLTLVSTHAWGALSSPYTCTFTAGMTMSGSNCTTGDVTWTISTTVGKGTPSITFGNQNTQSCIKFGSGKSNYYSKMTLTTSAFTSYNVSKVVIYASSNNGGSKTFKVTQGTTQIGTGSQTFSSTTWVTNITRNTTAGSGGDLSIEISSDATATFVHSIEVTYSVPSCTTKPTVGTSLTSVSSTVNSITATVPIFAIGGCNITENGLVYSTTAATPTVGGSGCTKVTTTACGSTAANKTVTISGLACGTSYYVRGYATNAAGTSYTNVTTQSTSACPKYTVTLKDDDTELTQASAGASVTLPSRTGCTDYTFAGWTKSWATAQTTWTTTAPTIIPAGSYTPTTNENLYPVYTKTEGGGSSTASSESISSTSTSAVTLETGKPITYTCSVSNAYSNPARIYKGNSITIAGGTITSISLTGVSDYAISNMTANTGTLTTNGDNGTWTGSASSITFTASTAQTRISALSVSYNGGSTTYYISVPNCCTPLGTINGPIIFINVLWV